MLYVFVCFFLFLGCYLQSLVDGADCSAQHAKQIQSLSNNGEEEAAEESLEWRKNVLVESSRKT